MTSAYNFVTIQDIRNILFESSGEKLDYLDPSPETICYLVGCDLRDDFCMQKDLEAEDLKNLSPSSPQDAIILL